MAVLALFFVFMNHNYRSCISVLSVNFFISLFFNVNMNHTPFLNSKLPVKFIKYCSKVFFLENSNSEPS